MKKISRIMLLSTILFVAPHAMAIAEETPSVKLPTPLSESRLMEWGTYVAAPFIMTADKVANFTKLNAALDYMATFQPLQYDCFVKNTHKIGSAIVAIATLCALYKVYKVCSTPEIDDEDDIFLDEEN